MAYTTKQELSEMIDKIEADAVDSETAGCVLDWVMYNCQQWYHKMDKKPKPKEEEVI